MSEQLSESPAARFEQQHVYAPADYDAYVNDVLGQWKHNATDAAHNGRPIPPVWVRQNGDMPTEFGAVVNYVMPTPEKVLVLGQIHISSDGGEPDVQVWLPGKDGSEEPIVASSEAYNHASLDRAIELIESQTR